MAGTNLLVFRDNASQITGRKLGERLIDAVDKTARGNDPEPMLNALLLAGQAECAIADSGVADDAARSLTDALAMAGDLVEAREDFSGLLRKVAIGLPELVRLSRFEGFAYYALHPMDFAEAAGAESHGSSVAVIGIRSIGSVLSAMAVAALKKRGTPATRITVRPAGHPYDRYTQFTESQAHWFEQEKQRGSSFLVVDEGPGLSGSSFLSVAEALVRSGINCDRITLMGTREVDPERLCTTNAARRWKQFRWLKASSRIWEQYGGMSVLHGGAWRETLLAPGSEWPPCWPEMERVKFLAPDGRSVFKFDGLGDSGERVRERSNAIWERGFGPKTEYAGDGMTAYEFVSGTPLDRSYPSAEMLGRIAEYCAFRATEFRTDNDSGDLLDQMASFNFLQEFGAEANLAVGSLRTATPIIGDGRMQPHEWIQGSDGRVRKVDASTHGDDHFFPGPTDIAWDLAGTIVEWDLSGDAETHFVEKYRERTGDDPSARLPQFLLAYSVFRMAYCKMASAATQNRAEKARLDRAYRFYRNRIETSCGAAAISRS
jgi:hypothetical protein